MNWIKENKFLAGLLVVLVIGVGAFGYLILNARGKLDEATQEYETQTAERTRLHNLKPYPSPENVKELIAQKEEATAKITELHKALAAASLPIEPMSPAQFQDKLRQAVTDVKQLAGTATAFKEADKFFLGFERYETTTPDTAAAPLLGRQLKAIQWLVTRFIENRASEIRELIREPLPEESGKAKETAPATPAKGGKAKVETPAVPLVVPHSIEIKVLGEPAGLRTVLNEIVSATNQFYIIRRISFLSEQPKAPSRTVAAPAGDGAAPADGAAVPAANAAPPSEYIVGDEKVELTLHLEMVDFAAVSKPEAK